MIEDTAPRLNILMSFPYMGRDAQELIASRSNDIRLLVDSGAFTAYKRGRPIAHDDYCNFIKNLTPKPWRYFMLDVVLDPVATWRNYTEMLDRGFAPIPIFTRGEHPDRIEEFYQTADVIGVGGLLQTKQRHAFVNGITRLAKGRKLHWLGFTNYAFVHHHRPYTCDSSTWANGMLWGEIRMYIGRGRWKVITSPKAQTRAKSHTRFRWPFDPMQSAALNMFGVPPMALMDDAVWHGSGSVTHLIGTRSMVKYMLDLQKHCGTLLFAAASASRLRRLLDAYDDEIAGRSVWWRMQHNRQAA